MFENLFIYLPPVFKYFPSIKPKLQGHFFENFNFGIFRKVFYFRRNHDRLGFKNFWDKLK